MSWGTDVKTWFLGSSPWPNVEGRLVDHQLMNGLPIFDEVKEVDSVITAATWRLDFSNGPTWPPDPTGAVEHYIALLIADPLVNGQTVFNGHWFRTTALTTLPAGSPGDPNGYIEVVVADPQEMTVTSSQPTPPHIPAGSPVLEDQFRAQLPISLDDNDQPIPAGNTTTPVVSTIATVTLTPDASGAVATAVFTGMTRHGPGNASIDYTFTLPLVIVPTQYPMDLARVLDVYQAENRDASFDAAPGSSSLGAQLKADLANVFSGIILQQLVPGVLQQLSDQLSAAVLKQGAALFGNASTLPAGIVLSCRDFAQDGNGVAVRMTLGAFGGVLNRFPQTTSSGGGIPCATTALAALHPALLSLVQLRETRDALLHTPAGAAVVDLYDRHRPELRDIVLSDPALAAATAELVAGAQRAVDRGAVPLALRVQAARLLRRFAELANPAFRAELEEAAGLLVARF